MKWHIVEQKSQHDQWSSSAISDCSQPQLGILQSVMTATTLSKRWSDTSEIKLGQSISLRSEFSVFIESGHELYRFSLC